MASGISGRFSKVVVRTTGSLFHLLMCDLGKAASLSEPKFPCITQEIDPPTLTAPKVSFRVRRETLDWCQGKIEY